VGEIRPKINRKMTDLSRGLAEALVGPAKSLNLAIHSYLW
jgi:hypothetical protein